jgi:iron(III) transport system substrate-binding protein
MLLFLGPLLGVHATSAPAQEVVIYSARIEALIKPMFDAFTTKTGAKVKYFTASEKELLERLKAEGANSPADALMTVDAGNLWLAQNTGVLQGFKSEIIDKNIPAHLHGKDNAWVGLSVRARPIMHSTERVKASELSTYEGLADPKWRGRICFRTSRQVYTQSLIATMIKSLGEKRTEEIVRGWMANQPRIIDSDTRVLETIAAGQCDVGLTNTYYLARLKAKNPAFAVAPYWPNQNDRGVHVNVSGAGVTKYAKNRQQTIKLIEFLSSPEAQNLYADVNYEYPANPAVKPHPLLASFGTFKADKVDIASAGEFQAAAVKLLDRVGYR